MKKISLVLSFVVLSFHLTHAQKFKKLKVGVGVGYAQPRGDNLSGGVLLFVHPAYRITDQFQLGIKFESASMDGRKFTVSGKEYYNTYNVFSTSLTGQYYISNTNFRPFIGLGVGLFRPTMIQAEGNNLSNATISKISQSESRFGISPSVGFDYRHFTFSVDFTYLGSHNFTDLLNKTQSWQQSYIGFRAGMNIGGGRKQ